MANICRVTLKNIEKYYYDPNGNLYFRLTKEFDSDYELMDGFDIEELKAAIAYGDIEMIYVSGPAQAIIEKLLTEEETDEVVCA